MWSATSAAMFVMRVAHPLTVRALNSEHSVPCGVMAPTTMAKRMSAGAMI